MIHYHFAMPGGLSTDLYELTMAAGYHAAGEMPRASFELFVRALPPSRGFLVAAGVEQALEYLESWRYTPDDVAYLRRLPALAGVAPRFFDEYLSRLRFSGDVWAVDEGVPVFAGEPLVRVSAPVAEAQLVETALLSTVLFQTMIASKAVRVVEAARGRVVVEFGGRRAHGTEAAMYAARAACLGGFRATSNLDAGFRFDLPVSGTMAHSWVMAQPDELTAFRRYLDTHGARSVLLIDTYDPLAATRSIVEAGLRPGGVRLDSGDLDRQSRAVRAILDAGGCAGTQILASGDLDEHRIAELVASDAPIDGFGVGTALSTSWDAPALSGVYKLVEIERDGAMVPLMKHSPGKQSLPGAKQVWRAGPPDAATGDVIGLPGEAAAGRPLLRPVMRHGARIAAGPPVGELQAVCRAAVRALPAAVRARRDPAPYPVAVSPGLQRLVSRLTGAAAATRPAVESPM